MLQFGSNLCRFWVIEVGQDVEGLLPRITGSVVLAYGSPGVAETNEGVGLRAAKSHLSPQLKGVALRR